jgi:quinol-cytochrome oxidoreductase complex cytochrome b subunit
LVRCEAFAALVALAILLLLVALQPVPLAAPLNENSSLTSDASAPWFFLWVQELLRFGDPFLFGIIIPSAFLALLALIPYLFGEPHPDELGRWFPRSGRRAQIVVSFLFAFWLALTLGGLWLK